ncbi:uncharacterized protein DS421_2g46680 [Arachis hypogaea]|nr:uncharacterized protein DS421_2g46680 [Arachis hypogaea]
MPNLRLCNLNVSGSVEWWSPPNPAKCRLVSVLSLSHSLAHGLTLTSSFSRLSSHLDGYHSQSLTTSLRHFLSLSSRPLTSVIVAVPCPCILFVSGRSRRN